MSEVFSWREFFGNFSYKPNFTFDFQGASGEFEFDSWDKVTITMMVPDSRVPRRLPEVMPNGVRTNIPLIPITKTITLGLWHGEAYALDYLRYIILDAEKHEIDEWFRYKGELIFDPHKEN